MRLWRVGPTNPSKRLVDALDECVARMRRDGASIEQCLTTYPALAAELRPLLETAVLSMRLGPAQAPILVKEGVRLQLMAAANVRAAGNGAVTRGELVAAALDECVARMQRDGASIQQCLAAYPPLAAALRPLLETAAVAMRVGPSEPLLAARNAARFRVMAAARTRAAQAGDAQRPWPWWSALARSALAPVPVIGFAVALVLLGGGGTAAVLSANALPGDSLYPVKLAAEEVQLRLTPEPAARAEGELRRAERRLEEMTRLAQAARPVPEQSLVAFEEHTARARREVVAAPESARERLDRRENAVIAQGIRTLEQVLEQVPDPAKPAIQRALERGREYQEQQVERAADRSAGRPGATTSPSPRRDAGRAGEGRPAATRAAAGANGTPSARGPAEEQRSAARPDGAEPPAGRAPREGERRPGDEADRRRLEPGRPGPGPASPQGQRPLAPAPVVGPRQSHPGEPPGDSAGRRDAEGRGGRDERRQDDAAALGRPEPIRTPGAISSTDGRQTSRPTAPAELPQGDRDQREQQRRRDDEGRGGREERRQDDAAARGRPERIRTPGAISGTDGRQTSRPTAPAELPQGDRDQREQQQRRDGASGSVDAGTRSTQPAGERPSGERTGAARQHADSTPTAAATPPGRLDRDGQPQRGQEPRLEPTSQTRGPGAGQSPAPQRLPAPSAVPTATSIPDGERGGRDRERDRDRGREPAPRQERRLERGNREEQDRRA